MKKTVSLLLMSCLLCTAAWGQEAEETREAMQAEIERLASIMPGQAFAMTQVAYNFNNLWFAAQAGNWPLAEFYLNETRVRLRWAMRITPVRNISTGEVELTPLSTALENTQLADLGSALAARDLGHFEESYRNTLDACQSCHSASEKGF